MSAFLHDLGAWCFKRPKSVLLVWVLLAAVLGGLAGTVGGSYDDAFTIPGAPSQVAYDKLEATFPQAANLTSNIVITVPKGTRVTDSDVRPRIEAALKTIDALPFVKSATSPWDKYVHGLVNESASAAVIQVDLGGQYSATEFPQSYRDQLLDAGRRIQDTLPVGAKVYVGGQAFETTLPSLSLTEVAGVAVALVILVVTLGSVVAAGLPIVTAVLGVGITYALLILAARFTAVNSTSPMLAVMLGLAVGIDYALFILSRHRDQLRDGAEAKESAATAVATSGSAVIFAGATVIIALIGLSVARIPFLTVMGIFAAIGVAFAVLIALTALPAFMGLLGERMRPRARAKAKAAAGPKDPRRGVFGWWARVVTRVPVLTILVVVVGLGALAVPAKDLVMSLPNAGENPAGTSSRQTYDVLTQEFGPGFNGPIIVTADIVQKTDPLTVIDGIKADIEKIPGVKMVAVAVPNQNADTAMIQVIPTTGPSDEATTQLVHRLNAQHDTWQSRYGVSTAVTGLTAIKIDVSNQLSSALLPFGIFVVGLCLVLLTMVFRSIVVPIKAVLGYLLSVGAGIGASQLVFNRGIGLSIINMDRPVPIIAFMPIVVMGILFGLAMDYEVFLVSRMREEYARGATAKDAVIDGLVHSGKVVSAAGSIMFAVFAFFVPEGMNALREIALALAIGVAADAFLVRMALVPAVLVLLGDRAWWLPAWLDRRMPLLDIEGSAITHEQSMTSWPTPEHTEALHAEGLAVAPLFSGIDLHLNPGDVRAAIGEPGQVTGLLLALTGRLTPDAGSARIVGQLLPERAQRVRRWTVFLDADSTTFVPDALDATARHPRLVVVDHADRVVTEEARAALSGLVDLARTDHEMAVLLGGQRAQRLDWLDPDAHLTFDQDESTPTSDDLHEGALR
ncbi:MMPL family transporter [Acidipropionibacterium timonense]|uniref:MMPL family transporter n=1 Tax=Acidipropionibacterium timonense TaxID=2161818 RepID=UPI0010322275|nr:MMPL family transporter [Acidipropionibacterium timonense]